MRHKGRASPYQADSGFEIAPMDLTQQGFEQTKKDRLIFPTDAAALLFGLLIFSVAIFALHRGFLGDSDTYWHLATGK